MLIDEKIGELKIIKEDAEENEESERIIIGS